MGSAKRHDVCRNLIRVWVQKYEAGGLTKTQPPPICSSNTKPRIAALERLVGKQGWSSSF